MREPRSTPMRGFSAAVAHVVNEAPQVQAGGIALGLSGEGDERCLALSVRHADGTSLVVYLSDHALGRIGDIVNALYGGTLAPAGVTIQ